MRKYSPIMPFPRRYSAMILFSFLAVFLAPVFAEEDIALVDLEVSLVKEFSGASIKAISPDGKNVFISDWETSEKKASLIKIGTWEIVKSFNFESPIVLADFFSDSQGLFIFNLNIDQLVLDLNTGQQTVVKKNASRSPYVRGTALPVHG